MAAIIFSLEESKICDLVKKELKAFFPFPTTFCTRPQSIQGTNFNFLAKFISFFLLIFKARDCLTLYHTIPTFNSPEKEDF